MKRLKVEYSDLREYSIKWNGEDFPLGMYFVNYKINNFNKTKN